MARRRRCCWTSSRPDRVLTTFVVHEMAVVGMLTRWRRSCRLGTGPRPVRRSPSPSGPRGRSTGCAAGPSSPSSLADFHVPGQARRLDRARACLVVGGFLATRSLLGEPVDRGSATVGRHLAAPDHAGSAGVAGVRPRLVLGAGRRPSPERSASARVGDVLQVYDVAQRCRVGRRPGLHPPVGGLDRLAVSPLAAPRRRAASWPAARRRSAARVIVGAAMVVADPAERSRSSPAGAPAHVMVLVTWFRIDGVLLGAAGGLSAPAARGRPTPTAVPARRRRRSRCSPARSVFVPSLVRVAEAEPGVRRAARLVRHVRGRAGHRHPLGLGHRPAGPELARVAVDRARSLSLYLWHYVVGVTARRRRCRPRLGRSRPARPAARLHCGGRPGLVRVRRTSGRPLPPLPPHSAVAPIIIVMSITRHRSPGKVLGLLPSPRFRR